MSGLAIAVTLLWGVALLDGSGAVTLDPDTLRELGVHRSTFYAWYRRYQAVGAAGLVPRPAAARRHWNRIPLRVRHRVVEATRVQVDGIIKLKLTAVVDAQHGGFTTGWSPASWGSIDELFVNLTVSMIPLPVGVAQ